MRVPGLGGYNEGMARGGVSNHRLNTTVHEPRRKNSFQL